MTHSSIIRNPKLLLLLSSLLVLILLPSKGSADAVNEKTIVTFSAPVEIPAFRRPMVLPKGTYVLKILHVGGDRNIVQIFNKGETHLYSTVISVPDYRLQPTGRTVIRFAERPANSPMALKAWFYPGDTYGQEFVYPKWRATELAKAAGEPVLSMQNAVAANLTKPIHSATDVGAQALEKTPLRAEKPGGGEESAQAVVGAKPK